MFTCAECETTYPDIVEKCVQCGHEVEIEFTHGSQFITIAAITTQLEKSKSGTLEIKKGRMWNLKNEVSHDFINKIELKFRRKN